MILKMCAEVLKGVHHGICTSTKGPDSGQDKSNIQFNKTPADLFQPGRDSWDPVVFSFKKASWTGSFHNAHGHSNAPIFLYGNV